MHEATASVTLRAADLRTYFQYPTETMYAQEKGSYARLDFAHKESDLDDVLIFKNVLILDDVLVS